LLVTDGYDGMIKLWNAYNGNLLRQINHNITVDFTPDGRYFITKGSGVIRVWGIPPIK
jgi:WD40 repeat protein